MEANGHTWRIAKVDDLSSFITVGFVGSMSSLFVDEGVPLLRGQNILPYRLDLTNLKYISTETHRKWKKSALKPRDVVIVRVGYPGTACVIPDGLGDLNAASLVIVRPNEELLDSDFLCYVLNSPWGKSRVQGRLVGSAQQVFNTHTAAELEIPAPPLPVQQRIAGILSAYDELIENSQRRIRLLEAMARALYGEWFVHFRFPGHEKHPRVASPLVDIPQGWEMKHVPECVDISPRVAVPRDGEKPFVPMGCLSNDSMLITDIESRAGNSGAKFQNGDTLFARITPCLENGKTGFVQFLPDAQSVGFGSTEFIVLRSRTLTPEFVYLLARSDEFRGVAIKSMSGATGRQRVQEKCFDDFQIVQPPRELLDRFSAIVAPSFRLIYQLHLQIQNLRRTRDLLLPRLLSGQVELKVADVAA